MAGELDWPEEATKEILQLHRGGTEVFSRLYAASRLNQAEFSLTFLLNTIDTNNLDTPKRPSRFNRFFKCQRAQGFHNFSD